MSQFQFQRPRTPDLLGRPNAGLLAGSGFAPAGPEGLALNLGMCFECLRLSRAS